MDGVRPSAGPIRKGGGVRIPLDRSSSLPLYQQIAGFLREQIRAGSLAPETRLPATRELARLLGTSRVTVANAYADLESEGLLISRMGSGTYVALLPGGLGRNSSERAEGDWPLWQQRLLTSTWLPAMRELDSLLSAVPRRNPISFASGMGATDLFPVADFRKALAAVLREEDSETLGYGDRAGNPALCATIAHILGAQGIPARQEEVLITSGSQQALALVGRLLLRPGDRVLVESPTYSGAIDLFRSLDVNLQGIPMDEEGMRMDRLEDGMRSGQAKLLYTIPTFHNPTGLCLSANRRRQVLALAQRYNVPVLEDDFAGDLRYDGRALPALKALDPGGWVIYTGTFSKMLMPGLRVGFLVASGPIYNGLLALKRTTDIATSNLMQRALQAYITVGRYQTHLRRACRVYRARRDCLIEALEAYMPAGTRWQTPQGGLFVWVRLPGDLSATALYPLAADEGVVFAPGSLFFPAERDQPYLRMNFTVYPADTIQEGVRRLAAAVAKAQKVSEGDRRRPRQEHPTTL